MPEPDPAERKSKFLACLRAGPQVPAAPGSALIAARTPTAPMTVTELATEMEPEAPTRPY